MFIGTMFPGDSKRIAIIQREVYHQALRGIVSFATNEHRHAEAVIGIRDELSELRDTLSTYDHRTLQLLHDRLAAAFRMEYCLHADLFSSHSQQPDTDAEIVELWLAFLPNELQRVFERQRTLPRLILTAISYPNPAKKGIDAEDELLAITNILYPDFVD